MFDNSDDEIRTRTIVGLDRGQILVWPRGEPSWQIPDLYNTEEEAATAVAKVTWKGVRDLIGMALTCDDPKSHGRPDFNSDNFAALTLKEFQDIAMRAKYFHEDPDAPVQPTKIGTFAIEVEDEEHTPLPQYTHCGDIIDSEEHRTAAADLLRNAYGCATTWIDQGAAIPGLSGSALLEELKARALGCHLTSEHIKGDRRTVAEAAFAMKEMTGRSAFVVKATLTALTPEVRVNCWEVSDLKDGTA